ncbi:Glycosyltransferase involved in cell wall bisynthesis [Halogranum amylolyticum]|uniref:Glycosyltransferase involved in cell wall bisynthesis n=1 Tax=Halogranum amylolyticum TaxID=660520 RepID=A0A1H8T710_9EURY|nr:glycosyltransferase [Halogranum amylolyticum]SEO86800.1 Glycosyltransferase involved in cell wall bisynthesis [Halogranum amylolyticum]
MVSVLLPTVEWGPVCEQLTAQLDGDDELLVVCDTESDPVADSDPPDGVRVLVAGEPEGCSGKANALAYGMERATCDRFLWTDDDFDHGEGWLQQVKRLAGEHGVVTGVPVFVGEGWWRLAEPLVAVSGSLGLYLGGQVWGGCVTFTRDDVDVERLVADLRRTVSDDGLLSARLDDVTAVRALTEQIRVDGDVDAVRQRLVRFTQTVRFEETSSTAALVGSFLLLALATLLWPLPVGAATTALTAGTYSFFGVRRSTFLLTAPGLLLAPLAVGYGLLVPEFEWGGRRYRWRDVYDVTVLE